MAEVFQDRTAPLQTDIHTLESKVKTMIINLEKPYLQILKKTYQCSSACYDNSPSSLQESHQCQKRCTLPLERIRNKHESSFAKFDVISN